MGYDCSITNRRGCNYCRCGKQVPNTSSENGLRWYINDSQNELQADNTDITVHRIKIFYCPICGLKLL
jgi:hypothetical protein